MMIIVIVIFFFIGLMDLPTLIKNKRQSDLIVYTVLFAFTLVLCCLYALGIKIPSSTLWFEHIIKVLHLNY